jgi:hypothetical protein
MPMPNRWPNQRFASLSDSAVDGLNYLSDIEHRSVSSLIREAVDLLLLVKNVENTPSTRSTLTRLPDGHSPMQRRRVKPSPKTIEHRRQNKGQPVDPTEPELPIDKASRLIVELLSTGPMKAGSFISVMKQSGITMPTLNRARALMRVVSYRDESGKPMVRLPYADLRDRL